jgi:hypothetical protein
MILLYATTQFHRRKLAIGSIKDIYETLTQFVSMKLGKSDIIR